MKHFFKIVISLAVLTSWVVIAAAGVQKSGTWTPAAVDLSEFKSILIHCVELSKLWGASGL